MKNTISIVGAAVLMALPLGALAQSAATEVQRNVNQQQRIEQGLKSGALTTREAASLEREEAAVNRMQSRALQDGKLSAAEKARIQSAQDRVSRDITRDTNNTRRGDPNSASSLRMQADVQRNINQQQRVEQGIKSGQLTNREVARVERGQSRVENLEARSGANDHVSQREQQRIQQAENHQSHQIHRERQNLQARR